MCSTLGTWTRQSSWYRKMIKTFRVLPAQITRQDLSGRYLSSTLRRGGVIGTALHDAVLLQLGRFGHRQAFLTTDPNTTAANFYRQRGWRLMGRDLTGEEVNVRPL